jgi:hypothetical protein
VITKSVTATCLCFAGGTGSGLSTNGCD